ncbi:MAG TPA: flagellar assembly peptidoglycan hydrolase FlgJ [Burkholderiales bacterium]|nr:flagellar assembly peptidoglycan hydrolase FlgJ [Burkholderiales bacterium]
MAIDSAAGASAALSIDAHALDGLKLRAQNDPQGAVKQAAQQFEALFLQMMLKTMREAGGTQDGPFDGEQTRFYTSMLDQQIAQEMSKRGTGLADVITRQLSQTTTTPAAVGNPNPAPASTSPAGARAQQFVSQMWPYAAQASQSTGVPPQFILAQAALESGWGQGEIRSAGGSNTYNLFGIKADAGWSGPTAEVTTTEYVNGAPQKITARFRVYGSYAEAFQDYAQLLTSQPRYSETLAQGSDAADFARGLQQAGYATDPMYADKLVRIINSNALRQGLAG